MSEAFTLRALALDDMAEAGDVCRIAFESRLPWLAGLHTPEETREYFRTRVFAECDVAGAFAHDRLVGVIAWTPGWITQLYVLPDFQGRGAGSALLAQAMAGQADVQLWTFQANAEARRFYEGRGFEAVETTDGQGNEQREPDVRYRWPTAA